jgi:hypothetical protein
MGGVILLWRGKLCVIWMEHQSWLYEAIFTNMPVRHLIVTGEPAKINKKSSMASKIHM